MGSHGGQNHEGNARRLQNLEFAETTVQIKSALNDASKAQLESLAAELCAD